MKLSSRFHLYLGLVFFLLMFLVVLHFKDRPLLLILAELFLVLLGVFGYQLVKQVFTPLETFGETTQLLREGDFTTRLKPVGQGELDQLIGVFNKMSEQLRRERTYNREQEFFLEKILRASTSGIITFDFEDHIERVNPSSERFLQIPTEAMVGRKLEEIESPLGKALTSLRINQSKILPFQGRRRLRCIRSQYLDRGFYKSFVFMDELTEELRQTEKRAYEKLVRVMSHEINNSLGAANSLLHSCLHYRDQISAEDRSDFEMAIKVVISRTEHLQGFMKDYSNVVKLPQPNKEPSDLNGLSRRIERLMETRYPETRWQWKLAETFPLVEIDPQQMEQVLINIVKNAVEAGGSHGEVTVSTKVVDRRPVLTVEDNGQGIPADMEDSLFTPFFTTKKEGQGIGLTLVQEILSNHGLDFGLERLNRGLTRFTIWF